jgi:predicted nucleic acid-binding protein
MTIVSNTGPLIALAKVNQLSLLERLFGQTQIPPAVHRELWAERGPEAAHLDEALTRFITVGQLPLFPPEVQGATLRLGLGEQQAIALAYELKMLLLIDDRLGRRAARRLRLRVIGLVGVLIRAKEASLVPAARPLLEEIRQRGYWLSDELLDLAARLAGEK